MTSFKKTVKYQNTNSYETLNELTNHTKNIWIVFHGIGFLSKYFLKYFKDINPNENYIVAPQAPSKYYLNGEYKYVGASWLTKEDTQTEICNVLNYIDAVLDSEKIPSDKNLIVLGFSQGVSIATRWLSQKKKIFNKLILYAGGIPNELTAKDFEYLDFNEASITIVYGDKDEFLNKERIGLEKKKIHSLFKESAQVLTFDGGHELKPELLKQFE
ncbi:esterase [Croceitalea sp. MTPC9]|uniref:alpha/beta hydrolase n=1 Tax=unclassified Croceitalea TaxID=2632280 RepID=UPI002B3B59E1|nr:esterase [Croceitalea sp. MTPC6]GMN15902.1 esterase [Croceitalea sp. MTPC9]